MKILIAMDKQSITQAELAARMQCSQQYVSSLLKGSSNMTLETVSRIEDALHIDILKSALTHVAGYSSSPSNRTHCLNDGDPIQYGEKK